MKIGFFGDSWIDVSDDQQFSWPILLSQKLNISAEYHGLSGTSHYYAFRKFLKQFKKFDIIVFSHTVYSRYPCIPEYEGNSHWNTGHHKNSYKSKFFDNVNPFYNDLFPKDFLSYVCNKIYEDINRICRENNIYLVNVLPFKPNYEFNNTEFPVVTKLFEVSENEKVKVEGKLINANEFNKTTRDFRFCHFNIDNNIIISNLLFDIIDNKVKNKHYDLLRYPFVEYDGKVDHLIKRFI